MTSSSALTTPIAPKHPWRFLTGDELDRLADATYQILEEVGVHFPLPAALRIFADHGAVVDHDRQIVRLQPDLVRRALASADRQINAASSTRERNFS